MTVEITSGHRSAPRRLPFMALLALCALLVAACGLRADEQAASTGGAAPGDTTVSETASQPTDGTLDGDDASGEGSAEKEPSSDGASSTAADDGGGAQPGAAAAGGGGDDAGSGGDTAAASASCTSNAGATDSGVTESEILIGGITGEGGPADATLAPYKVGFAAGLAEINAGGGICGRQMRIVYKSTGGSADRYGKAARELIENEGVFALTAVDLAHQGGANYIAQQRVPVIGGESAANTWFQNPMYFPIGNQFKGTAMMADWAVKNNRGTKFAIFSLALAVSQEGCAATRARLQELNASIVYEASVPVGSPDLTSYVQEARSNGADAILQCFDVGTGVALMRTLQQQQYDPYVGAVSGTADTLILDAASADVLEGMEVNFPTPAWIDDTPAMAQYRRSHAAVGGGDRHSSFGVRGYIAAKLMEFAFRSAGPELTREKVVDFLNSLDAGDMDLGGLMPPDQTFVPDANGFHREPGCSRQYAISGGAFVLVSDGWTCI